MPELTVNNCSCWKALHELHLAGEVEAGQTV